MKILFITPEWGYLGGREQYVIETIEELSLLGFSCCVVYAKQTDRPFISDQAGRIPSYQIPTLLAYTDKKDSEYENRMLSIIRNEKPDIIYIRNIRNISILRLLAKYESTVAMAHGPDLFCLRGTRTRYFSKKICQHKLGSRCLLYGCFIQREKEDSRRVLRYRSLIKLKRVINLYRKMNAILVVCNYVKGIYLQHNFPADKVHVIYDYVKVSTQKGAANYIHRDNNILFIGRIDRYKGLDYLFRALKKVKGKYICLVIGEGEYLNKYKKLSKRLDLEKRIRFLGWVNRYKIKEYIDLADMVVVPSLLPEGLPRVCLESMASEKPIVAYDSGGISDCVLNGKTGFLVPPKDVSSLAQKIEFLITNPDVAIKYGQAGRSLLETKFSKDKHFALLIDTFEKAIQLKRDQNPSYKKPFSDNAL